MQRIAFIFIISEELCFECRHQIRINETSGTEEVFQRSSKCKRNLSELSGNYLDM